MTTTKPDAVKALVTDVHAAVRHIHGVQGGSPLAKVQTAFQDHVGADWRRDLPEVVPTLAHTYQCVEMGWWLLHELDPDTPCVPRSVQVEPMTTALPVLDDVVSLKDGTTARILQRYDDHAAPAIRNKWQATGPEGARVISLDDITGYPEHDDPNHAVARVLNAAMNWENAARTAPASIEHMAAADALHAAVRAYLPLVAK